MAGGTSNAQPQTLALQATQPDVGPSGRQAPLAVYFPSGYRPAAGDGCRWELHIKGAVGSRGVEHCIVGRLPAVDLVGSTREAAATAAGPLPCRYALGVLDRASGTLQYSGIEGGRIVRVEPRVKAIDYLPTGAGTAEDKRRLVEEFGSQKRKKRQKRAQDAAVSAHAVGGAAAVKSMLAGIQEKAAAEGTARPDVMAAVQSSRQLPPHHPEATEPQQAYRLPELIPAAAWSAADVSRLRKGATNLAFREGELRESGEVHEYVLGRLTMIPAAASDAATPLLRAAAYLSVLMKLHGLGNSLRQTLEGGGLAGLAASHSMQVELLDAALAQFYEARPGKEGGTIHSLSGSSRLLMRLHILVLALILEGHQLDTTAVEGLKKALALKPTALTSGYRELGCQVKTSRRGGVSETSIILLPPVHPPKTLAEYFPAVKPAGPRSRR